MSTYLVTIEVRVIDKRTLFEAARKHGIHVDLLDERTVNETLTDEGACLVMLLDPGILPGCEIIESSTEIV